jgi:hypothetical protein
LKCQAGSFLGSHFPTCNQRRQNRACTDENQTRLVSLLLNSPLQSLFRMSWHRTHGIYPNWPKSILPAAWTRGKPASEAFCEDRRAYYISRLQLLFKSEMLLRTVQLAQVLYAGMLWVHIAESQERWDEGEKGRVTECSH